jgi:hypothetical protein
MQILDNLIIVSLIILAFIAGMKIDSRYHEREDISVKDALERQFLRLRAKADADDPCRPYGTPQVFHPIPKPTGDFDGDNFPIKQDFLDELKSTGRAKTTIRKSDISK